MDSLGTAVSVALQYGVPIQSLVNKFTHQRFEPAGMTGNRDIPFAKSLVDYIFRWMGMEFIPGYREANAPKRGAAVLPSESPEPGDHHPHHVSSVRAVTPHQTTESTTQWNEREAHSAAAAPATLAQPPQHQRSGHPTPSGPSGAPATTAEARARGPVPAAAGAGAGVGETEAAAAQTGVGALSMAMQNAMGDAPACDVCGAITVRSGTCYKCLNCGNSMGCS
jgi:ribonucleoside-diphosphate reductase alpha chain